MTTVCPYRHFEKAVCDSLSISVPLRNGRYSLRLRITVYEHHKKVPSQKVFGDPSLWAQPQGRGCPGQSPEFVSRVCPVKNSSRKSNFPCISRLQGTGNAREIFLFSMFFSFASKDGGKAQNRTDENRLSFSHRNSRMAIQTKEKTERERTY